MKTQDKLATALAPVVVTAVMFALLAIAGARSSIGASDPTSPHLEAETMPYASITPAGDCATVEYAVAAGLNTMPANLVAVGTVVGVVKGSNRDPFADGAVNPSPNTPKPNSGRVAQLSSSIWTPVGKGIISPNIGDSEGMHHQCGRLIQSAWRFDNIQRQNVLWMGAAVGGLWKSIVDSGGNVQSWIPLTDNFPGPHTMGSFLVHRLDSNNILIGPGSLWESSGDGNVYRTYDQGVNWYPKQLPVDKGGHAPTRINRLVEDRSDPSGNTVLACTSNGIYRSTNFGITWKQVSEDFDEVTDMVQDTGAPATWYAAGLVNHVILRSQNSGTLHTWHSYFGSDPIPGPVGRVSLAACDSDPNVLYALVVEPESGTTVEGHLKGVYRSTDHAMNWTRIFDDSNDPNMGNEGMHTCAIACDPINPNHIVFGLMRAHESFDATSSAPTFHKIDGGHPDYNFMLFGPEFGTVVVMANDGGYYIYHPFTQTVDDSGNLLGINATFLENKQGGLASSRALPERFIAGLVDNGLVRGNAALGTLELMVGRTDGGQVSIMPDNPGVMAASANGDRHTTGVSFDHGQRWFDLSDGLPDQGDDNFPSMLIDPTPGLLEPLLFTHSQTIPVVNFIYYRNFLNLLTPDWLVASPIPIPGEISHLDHTTDAQSHTLIFTLKGDQHLFKFSGPRSQIGLLAPANITPPLPPLKGKADAHANADKSGFQPHTLYYTTAKARPSKTFVSTDDGVRWKDVSGNLPMVAGNTDYIKLIGNPSNLNQLFLATNNGVFRTDTGGASWFPYSDGLRLNEEVQDIVINFDNQNPPTLYIATRGRGFWQILVK